MFNVEEILQENEIEYHATNTGYLIRCLNPEHEDKNPSMLVDKITGRAKCFSCNFKTNVVSYYHGPQTKLEEKRMSLFKAIVQKLNQNQTLQLPENPVWYGFPVRGISAKTIHKFQGFVSPEEPSRLTFPIRNLSDEIVGFVGWHRDGGDPKYKIWPSGVTLPLFPFARPIKGRVIIVEGVFDAINLHDKGLTNATAALGANNISDEKIELLKLQGTDGIDIMFDGDKAGKDAARKLYLRLKEHDIKASFCKLKDDQDPADLTEAEVKAWRKKLYNV